MTLIKDKAIKAMLLGDWESATTLNKALIKENPADIDALNRLAYAFTVLGKIKDAKSTYKKVLKLDMLNQIALRNMKKLNGFNTKQAESNRNSNNNHTAMHVNHTFLEETGKTKIVSLVNTAQPKILALLTTGQPLAISIKRSKIFIQNYNNQYLGVLPDDIGRRLIKLINGDNVYNVWVKSANEHNVAVFIKEIKRSARYKNQPSFLATQDPDLNLSKRRSKIRVVKESSDDEEDDSNYSSDDES